MTDHDQTIITGVLSVMGEVGLSTDHKRLRAAIENGAGRDKLTVAVEIAVAFMRLSEELTADNERLRDEMLQLTLAAAETTEQMDSEIAELKELLRECVWTVEQDAFGSIGCVLLDRIKAASDQ